MSDSAFFGLLGSLVAFVVALIVLWWTGGTLLLFFAAAGPAIAYLFGGAPRLIEVHHDRVVLRYWLRRTKILLASELAVQQMSDELILIHEGATYGIDAEHFSDRSFSECSDALRLIAKSFLNRA